eukprot:TRINITY_DN2950_c0_g1_i1.p2 TRINITY_DN2950_c0_g1~~TRINITY_DN2950_c0_g1_i1.p2  ORF type:complete len:354 (+),score=119.84 TRINITY_DN2950_c0_g1_i1:68-1063(+)
MSVSFWATNVAPGKPVLLSNKTGLFDIANASTRTAKAELWGRSGAAAEPVLLCTLLPHRPQRQLDVMVGSSAAMELTAVGAVITVCGSSEGPVEGASQVAPQSPAASPAAAPSPRAGTKRTAAGKQKKAASPSAPAASAPPGHIVAPPWAQSKTIKRPQKQVNYWQRTEDLRLLKGADEASDDDTEEVEARPVVVGGKDYFVDFRTYRAYQGAEDSAEPCGWFHPELKKVLSFPPQHRQPAPGEGAERHRRARAAAAAAGEDSDTDAVIGSDEDEDEEDVGVAAPAPGGRDNIVTEVRPPAEQSKRYWKKRRTEKVSATQTVGVRPAKALR